MVTAKWQIINMAFSLVSGLASAHYPASISLLHRANPMKTEAQLKEENCHHSILDLLFFCGQMIAFLSLANPVFLHFPTLPKPELIQTGSLTTQFPDSKIGGGGCFFGSNKSKSVHLSIVPK
jgi:hypothetical protein